MKIKIFNIKMKKGFLRIAASLLACASLMVSVAIPGQAAKDRVLEKFFGKNYESNPTITTLLAECQNEIQSKIDKELETDFKQNDSIEISGYTFTKKRYQHIAYGDYQNGVSFSGLHMNCGLDLLEESLKIFKKKIEEALNKNSNFITLTKEEKEAKEQEALEKVINAYNGKNDTDSDLMHCQLIHSNVSHTSRYLFPKNWGFAELKKALKIAIDQKAEFAKTLEEKSDDIAKNKQAIQNDLNNIEKDKKTKKDLNDLLKQYVLNDMIYGCEKKQLALKDECFPNLYGYANTNGKSVSLHIIDIGEVKDNKKSGKKILVQLVTDELSKEIVTFFPINVQDLKDGEFRIVPNEGEDDEDDRSNNSPKADSNSPKTNNNSSKTKIYDIFQLDKLNGKQFLKRTKFEISDKFKNNESSLINNGNMNVLRGILNKIGGHLNDDQSKKYFKELDAFVNNKLTNYIKSSKNELESIKKVDTLDESNAGASNEKDKKLQKTQLIKKLKSEFEKLGKNTSLPQSSDKTDEKELDEAKTFMLTTILGNVFCINNQINNANTQLEKLKNKKDDLVKLRSDIDGLRKRLANNIELMQRSGIETLLIDGLRKQLESYKKNYKESLKEIEEGKLSKTKTSNETELLNKMLGEIEMSLSNLKNWDKCEVAFAQGGLDLSEEVKNLGSVDKYMGELDQLLNGLIVNDNVFSSVITLMKNKLKDNADREEKAKKAAEEKAKKAAEAEKEEDDLPIDIFG